MSVKNLSGSAGVLYEDRRDFYIDPQVVKELWTDVTPFTTVISNKESRSGLADPVFKMFEHRNPWQKQSVSIKYASVTPAVGTAIALTGVESPVGLEALPAANKLAESMNGLEVEWTHASGKRCIGVLSGGGSTGSPKLTPVYIPDSPGAAANSTAIVASVVGNAHAEGSHSPEAWQDELQVVFNSCQIFKTPIEITGTLYEAALRGEKNELARLRKQKAQEHKIQKERAFLFGGNRGTGMGSDSFQDTGISISGFGNGGKIRTTMGIITALEKYGDSSSSSDAQNVFASGDIDSYGEFIDAMEKVFQYVPSSGVKRAFVGAGALGYWSKQGSGVTDSWAKNTGWTVNIGDLKRDKLGFNYRTLETPHGMLQLIPAPAMRGDYNKKMLIVDDDNLFHAAYRRPKFQANIKKDNAYDGVKDQYFSDEGIGVSLIESHSLMTTP